MRKLALLFTVLSLATLGCSSSGTGSTCTVTPPDTTVIACDVTWSCDDETVYRLACASESGSYKCQCDVDGVIATAFNVATFDCTTTTALSTATSGCGWAITVAE